MAENQLGQLAGSGLPAAFFREARRLFLGETTALAFEFRDLLMVAESPALRAEFRSLYRTEVQNPEFGLLIREFLDDVATDLEDKAKVTDIRVDLLDKAGLGVAVSIAVAGVAAIVASGGTAGAVVLLASGVTGLASTGAGRTILKLGSQRDLSAAQKIRRLARTLEDIR